MRKKHFKIKRCYQEADTIVHSKNATVYWTTASKQHIYNKIE